MNRKSIPTQLVQGTSQIRGLSINAQNDNTQVVSIMDVISEGPIKGLVNGINSVFLNDESFTDEVSSIEVGDLKINYNENSVEVEGEPDLNLATDSYYVFTARKAEEMLVTIESYNDGSLQSFLNIPVGILLNGDNGFTEDSKYFRQIFTTPKEMARLVLNNGVVVKGYLKYAGSGLFNQYNQVLFMPLDISPTAKRQIEIDQSGPLMSQNLTLEIDYDVIYLDTLELQSPWPFESASLVTQISERAYKVPGGAQTLVKGPAHFMNQRKLDGSSFYIRNGTFDQQPIEGPGGIGNISITSSINDYMTKYEEGLSDEDFTEAEENTTVTINSTEMGLSLEQMSEVDEVRVAFQYDSLVSVHEEDGKEKESGAVYNIKIVTYEDGDRNTGTPVVAFEDPRRVHKANSTVPISFEETYRVNQFRPFRDFEIVIERLTRHNGVQVDNEGNKGGNKNKLSANCKISTVTSIIKELFHYPYTAHANLTFSSVDYSETPSRSYEIYGKKVKIPSNYTTRENNDGLNAIYTGFWDGTFKGDPNPQDAHLEYTDNPAWVFYDILTNNNYGLGNWISEDNIDKYSLYRIAKYCDELVPDGAGGLEPRFRANIYLAKQADAYKVLKDMASIFFGMLYWMDGKIVAVNDEPKDPLFTFAKANVINGAFSYENTGSKTRSNQVVVYWNNPEDSYAAEPLIVEDRENIISTGKIIKEDVSAFGCTSRGQAYRYGAWKLWTAKNQTEIVSFSTSIDAAFLAPGDVIKIQDADRFNTAFSGRLKALTSSTELELDRQILLTSGRTYELSITLIDPTSETDQTLSTDEVRELQVETKTITATSTGAVSSLTIPTAFSESPTVGAVWVIKEKIGEATVDGSAKDYRILSISESSKNEYSITAVEYYDEKFDSVYGDLNLYTIENIFPDYTNSSAAYPPENVYVSLNSDPAKTGDEFKIMWDTPVDLDLAVFNDVAGYEIHHNITKYPSPIKVGGDVTSYSFVGVDDGTYSVAIRSVNTSGYRSSFEVTNFKVEDKFRLNVPRQAEGVGIGGIVGAPIKVDNGVVKFADSAVDVTNPGIATIVNPTNVITSNISTLDMSGLEDDTYEVLFDASALELKAVLHKQTQGLGYWYDAAEEEYSDALSGSVSLDARSSKVRGTDTAFLSELEVGDVVFIGSKKAKVTSVISDTLFLIDRSFAFPSTNNIPYLDFDQNATNDWVPAGSTLSILSENSYSCTSNGNGMRLPNAFSNGLDTSYTVYIKATLDGTLEIRNWDGSANLGSLPTIKSYFSGDIEDTFTVTPSDQGNVSGIYLRLASAGSISILALEIVPTQPIVGNTFLKKVRTRLDFLEDSLIAKVKKLGSSYLLGSYLSLDSTILPRQTKQVSIYLKEATASTPTGGDYYSPIAAAMGTLGWSISPQSLTQDGDIVYVSTRTFTSDGQQQDNTWSTPTIYSQREDGSNIDVRIDSSEGTVFKNNSGSTVLKATVLEDGTELSDTLHNSMSYAWTNGQEGILCVDASTREVIDNNGVPLLATGSEGSLVCSLGVPADSSEPACTHGSNLREIILGAEDVTNKQNINVIVGSIPE